MKTTSCGSRIGRSIRGREKYLERKARGVCVACQGERENKDIVNCNECCKRNLLYKKKFDEQKRKNQDEKIKNRSSHQ